MIMIRGQVRSGSCAVCYLLLLVTNQVISGPIVAELAFAAKLVAVVLAVLSCRFRAPHLPDEKMKMKIIRV